MEKTTEQEGVGAAAKGVAGMVTVGCAAGLRKRRNDVYSSEQQNLSYETRWAA
jgi:hypothetical protein